MRVTLLHTRDKPRYCIRVASRAIAYARLVIRRLRPTRRHRGNRRVKDRFREVRVPSGIPRPDRREPGCGAQNGH